MLQRIRDRIVGKFALAIVLLLAVSFVFFGVNMNFMSGSYFAKVNGKEISAFEAQSRYQNRASQLRQQFGGQLPPAIDQQLQRQALEEIILEAVVSTYLDDAGYRITDAALVDAIRQMPLFQDDSGNFSRELYQQELAARGRTQPRFEQELRDSLRIEQLRDGISATAFVTPGELRRQIELAEETRELRFATLSREQFLSDETPADDEIQAYYDENTALFQTDESATVDYVELNRDAVAATVALDENTLASYYETVSDQFTTPPERNPRHILLSVDAGADEARTLAADILDRVNAGEEFAELAAEYSQDGGSASRGGDLGWVSKGQFVGPVDDAVFSMSEGEIRGPIESEFGLHIVRLDGIRGAEVPPLAEVRERVERQYRDEQAGQRFLSVSNELADSLFDNPDLEQLAGAAGLEIQTIDEFTRADGGLFANNERALDAVFGESAVRGDALSDAIEIADDRIVVIRVAEYRPAATRPLAAVRDDIAGALLNERADQALAAAAARIESAAMDSGSLTAAAGAESAEVSAAATITRTDAEVPAPLRTAVFDVPFGGDGPVYGTVVGDGGERLVYELTAVTPGRATELSVAERENRRRRLAGDDGNIAFGAFVAELRDRADVEMGAATLNDNANEF